jgi:hypothetical protein
MLGRLLPADEMGLSNAVSSSGNGRFNVVTT